MPGYFIPVDELVGGSILTSLSVVLPGYGTPQTVIVPASGATVYVYLRGTTTQVACYEDQHGAGSPAAQPFTTDANGHVVDGAANRVYVGQPLEVDVNVSGAGLTPRTIPGGSLAAQATVTNVQTVASQAAMLALTTGEGTVAIRTDLNRAAFINNGGTSGTVADWSEIGFGDVESVNGHTGVVVLTATDVAAMAASTTLNAVPAPTADVSLNNHKITALTDATNPQDALNLRAAQAAFAPIGSGGSGGALTTTLGRTGTVLRDFVALKDFAANGGLRSFTSGGSLTGTGPYTLADAGHAIFTSAMVGWTVNLVGANTNGATYSTTVASFTDTGHVVLTGSPPNVAGFTGAYQIGKDDTTPLSNAAAAVNSSAPGTGVVYAGNDAYMVSGITPNSTNTVNITFYCYGATFWTIATGNSSPTSTVPIFGDRNTDGVTIKVGFKLLGGMFHGEGQTLVQGTSGVPSNQLDLVWLNQYQFITIRDVRGDGFSDSVFQVGNSKYVTIETCQLSNSTMGGGRNVVNFRDAGTTGTTVPQDQGLPSMVCAKGLLIFGHIPTEGIAAAAQDGIWAYVILALNQIVCDCFGCVAVELNTYQVGGTGAYNESSLSFVILASNILVTSSTAICYCIYFVGDDSLSANASTDPNKFSRVVITGNIGSCASNGGSGATLYLGASQALVEANDLSETGTRGTCLLTTQTPTATGVAQLEFIGNQFKSTNTGATNSLVNFTNSSNFRMSGGLLQSASTVSTSDTIKVSGGCSNWTIGNGLHIEGAGGNGVNVLQMNNGRLVSLSIHNPNASNSAGSGSSSGVCIQGSAPTGSVNELHSLFIWDDRGTGGSRVGTGYQMRYAVCATNSTGTLPHMTNCRLMGALTGITNASNTFGWLDGNRTDDLSAWPAGSNTISVPASASAYTNAFSYAIEVSLSSGTGTLVTKARGGGTARPIFNQGTGAAMNVTFTLRPGDSFTPTYTSVPTANYFPLP